jgi:ATP-dependent DNA helicase RecG
VIDFDELESRFREDEGDRVEHKRDASDLDTLRKAICALANDLSGTGRSGVLFVGQADDKSCGDLKITDRLVEQLTHLRGDGKILPYPDMNVVVLTISGSEVVAISIAPHDNPPVRMDGRTYVRVGLSTRVATADEERRLVEKRRWSTLFFDAKGISGATLEDLDLVRFTIEYLPSAVALDVLEENGRTQQEQLRALRLIDQQGRPTATALLVVGKEPQAWLPGAYVQALRIAGTELADPIRDQKRIGGTIPDQIRQLDQLTNLWIEYPTAVGDPVAKTAPKYSSSVLRQLLRVTLSQHILFKFQCGLNFTFQDAP